MPTDESPSEDSSAAAPIPAARLDRPAAVPPVTRADDAALGADGAVPAAAAAARGADEDAPAAAAAAAPPDVPTAAAAAGWPPAGFVDAPAAPAALGVSGNRFGRWEREGRITCGRNVRRPGQSGRRRIYPLDELRGEVEAARAAEQFPPPGFVDVDEAPRTFGLSGNRFRRWEAEGRITCGRTVPAPGLAGVRKVYPLDELGREVEAARAAEQFPPPGTVDGDGAAAMFGLSPITWKQWVTARKVPAGRWVTVPAGGRCYVYAVADLERLREELRGADKAYWDPANPGFYRVPDGWVRQRAAWRMFGVDLGTWKRWEREGQVSCGRRVNAGGPKLYPVEELKRLVEEFGRYVPPYPDPARPDCYRVPLSGHDIRRREAIIDAADLSVVEGRRWNWGGYGEGRQGDGGGSTGCVSMSHASDKSKLHRLILGVTDPALEVMHLNDDPLDCRRANLVVRTPSEKGAAARKRPAVGGRPCTSRYKGVSWDRKRGKWVAQIKGEGQRHLGRFDDELAAAEAYDEAARAQWGEHARINFPDGIDAALARAASGDGTGRAAA